MSRGYAGPPNLEWQVWIIQDSQIKFNEKIDDFTIYYNRQEFA